MSTCAQGQDFWAYFKKKYGGCMFACLFKKNTLK